MMITAQGLTKEFIRQGKGTNRFVAVQPADIEIESGKFTLLMGRSGSGKSTLLNMLAGLLTPTAGKVFYGGEDIYSMDDGKLSRFRSEHIGVIPQGQTAVHSLTVTENICLSYMMYGTPQERVEAKKYAAELMERFDISPLAQAMPSELSGDDTKARCHFRGRTYL